MIARGGVCMVESGGGPRVPVVVVQSDPFNASRIPTAVVVPLSGNLRLLEAPGNVLVPSRDSRQGRDLVANVAHPLTLERRWLRETPGRVSEPVLRAITDGLRLVLAL